MKVWNGSDTPREASAKEWVVSIGNYDGVHQGHATILKSVCRDARKRGAASLLLTFEPHPLTVVAPERSPQLLQTRRQKIDALERAGLDHVWILNFNQQLAQLDGETFVRRILLDQLDVAAIHVGNNFHFGRERSGNVEQLSALGARLGFEVNGIGAVMIGDGPVSSSRIRQALQVGDLPLATALLGRPYSVEGTVVRGEGRGRSLQFPTANLQINNELHPPVGVYVTESRVDALRVPSITNIGFRPTFEGHHPTIETHLLDFSEDIYGRPLELSFLARLRDEIKFETPAALREQIVRDRAAAEQYFSNLRVEQS